MGYNEVELRCDNEPSIMQVAKLTIQARQQMEMDLSRMQWLVSEELDAHSCMPCKSVSEFSLVQVMLFGLGP